MRRTSLFFSLIFASVALANPHSLRIGSKNNSTVEPSLQDMEKDVVLAIIYSHSLLNPSVRIIRSDEGLTLSEEGLWEDEIAKIVYLNPTAQGSATRQLLKDSEIPQRYVHLGENLKIIQNFISKIRTRPEWGNTDWGAEKKASYLQAFAEARLDWIPKGLPSEQTLRQSISQRSELNKEHGEALAKIESLLN